MAAEIFTLLIAKKFIHDKKPVGFLPSGLRLHDCRILGYRRHVPSERSGDCNQYAAAPGFRPRCQ